jgi:hypothetical protein
MSRGSVILLFALAATGPALGGDTDIASGAFGKVYWVTVTRAALEKAPVWKDDADNPPLPARKAMQLADRLKGKLVKDDRQFTWKRESVALEEGAEGRWYWLVTYRAQFNGIQMGPAGNLRLAVLMDGTVIEPTVRNERR